jgi:hypothetical protein
VLGDGRRRAAGEARDRPNALEQVMDVARAAGDDDKLLRALARDVVWYSGTGPAPSTDPGPIFVSVPADQVQLPVARGQDGRSYLLAFSSRAALVAHEGDHRRSAHLQVPAGQLFALLPGDLPVLLNASGPRLLVVEPDGARTVAALHQGHDAPAAFLPGPASGLLLAPLDDAHREVPDRVRAAADSDVIAGLWAGRAVLDEPDARPYVVVTAQVRADVDAVDLDAAMQLLVRAAEAATTSFTWVRPVRGDAPDELLAWLRANTPELSRR